jgi:hypothetical protein
MSFAPQSVSDPNFVPAEDPVDTLISEADLDTEDVDLESVAGRSLLIQEIENLALTCDVADDPKLFANSEVFHLVAKLQSALAEIEQTMALDEEVTAAQAQAVQDLYDQLAIKVEQPAVISVYVGPSRRDMVLEDLSDEGKITITQPKKAEVEIENAPVAKPSENKLSFIHNSLPEKPTTQTPAGQPKRASKKTETVPKVDASQIALQKVIDKIEAAEMSFLDTWINDYQSPYKVLGDMPFADLQKMAAAPINSRQYVEFKSLLELQKIKYEVFNQWSQDFADMEQVVDRAKHKSFKQVLDEYLTIILAS